MEKKRLKKRKDDRPKMPNIHLSSMLRRIPIRTILIVPFIIQLLATVGRVGYLSYRSGQQAVQNLSESLMTEVAERVNLYIQQNLQTAIQINKMNIEAVRSKTLDLDNLAEVEKFLWLRIKQFETVTGILLGLPDGTLADTEQWKLLWFF